MPIAWIRRIERTAAGAAFGVSIAISAHAQPAEPDPGPVTLPSPVPGLPPVTLGVPTPEPAPPPPPPTRPAVEPPGPDDGKFPWKKVGSATIVGAIYGTAWTWVSAAWWSRLNDSTGFTILNEGTFGVGTYAGGSDKLGHYYTNYIMNRGFAGILEWGGFPRMGSIATATGLTTLFFTGVEFKDAYHKKYGFSFGDITANLSGQATALGLMLVPELDTAVSVKIQYFPSQDFFHALSTDGPLNTPEDYSGQTYLVCYHLISLPFVREEKSLRALRYVDFSLGYGTLGYKPVPDPPLPVRQNLSIGFNVNLQAAFDELLWPRGTKPNTGTQVVHFVNEVYQPPYTRVPLVTLTRTGPPTKEGRN